MGTTQGTEKWCDRMFETGTREECRDPVKTCECQEFPRNLHVVRLLLLQVSTKRERQSAGKSGGNRGMVGSSGKTSI